MSSTSATSRMPPSRPAAEPDHVCDMRRSQRAAKAMLSRLPEAARSCPGQRPSKYGSGSRGSMGPTG